MRELLSPCFLSFLITVFIISSWSFGTKTTINKVVADKTDDVILLHTTPVNHLWK